MANLVVVGGQWGDEGKGKVVDLLGPSFTHVVRFNGGNNAGHTVRFADRHFALHLVPSGIVQPGCRCHIGPGVVIDPIGLMDEIRQLEEQSIQVRSRLLISPRAHLVLPAHRALDLAREQARGGGKIGTTGKGIGPAYETRAARTGVRLGLARNPKRFRDAVADTNREIEKLLRPYPDAAPPGVEENERAIDAALTLAPMLGDVSEALWQATQQGEAILFEGAQGTFLDIDHGTYPFVTSSAVLAGFAAPACGLPASALHGVLAVFKAYTTRVGGGPFPTELAGGAGEHLRRRGNEFGTTTGRPRRTGWFDAVAARASVRWNGVEAVALTKLDVLDELAEIPIGTAYHVGSRETTHFPDDTADLLDMDPLYEVVPGWRTSTSAVTAFERLPDAARRYVARLEELLGVPIVLISTGPRREETIIRTPSRLTDWVPSLNP